MPLPLPNLDTRRWADLVDEGRAVVPRYAGTWTDHNVHDPGITLVELFAYLVENLLYRVNRIPERHRRKFLALAGFVARPPAGAFAVLQARLQAGAGRVDIPAEAVLIAASERGPLRFSAVAATSLLEAELRSVYVFDGTGFTDCSRFAFSDVGYPAFGSDPTSAGARQPALYLGLDRPPPPGAEISLYIRTPGAQPDTAALLREEAGLEDCPPHPPRVPCHPCPPARAEAVDRWCETGPIAPPGWPTLLADEALPIPPHHSARVVWEYVALDGWRPLDGLGGSVDDRTRSLTLDGWVRIRVPGPMDHRSIDGIPEARCWIRCRFARGSFDAAPVIAGPIMNALPVVQCVPIPAGEAILRGAADDGSGLPDQVVRLSEPKVADGRIRVETVEPDGVHRWDQRVDFDASDPRDLHFVLDPEAAVLRFGNGARGRVPPDGASFFLSYAATEGARGEVSAGKSWSLAETAWNEVLLVSTGRTVAQVSGALQRLSNPFPASGGRDIETLGSVEQRAGDLLWAHERLVQLAGTDERATLDQLDPKAVRSRPVPQRATTGLDFERIALGVPGTVVKRARAWTNFDPQHSCLEAAGTMTVVVVPALPREQPKPSRGLLAVIRGYLRRRRVLGTRVLVVGPEYLTVSVRATIVALRNADASAVRQAVIVALRKFLHPLDGGPAGLGWPFGRDVYRSEILAVMDGVAGVDHVVDCTLVAGDEAVPCANVCIPPTGLVASGDHQVEVIGE